MFVGCKGHLVPSLPRCYMRMHVNEERKLKANLEACTAEFEMHYFRFKCNNKVDL